MTCQINIIQKNVSQIWTMDHTDTRPLLTLPRCEPNNMVIIHRRQLTQKFKQWNYLCYFSAYQSCFVILQSNCGFLLKHCSTSARCSWTSCNSWPCDVSLFLHTFRYKCRHYLLLTDGLNQDQKMFLNLKNLIQKGLILFSLFPTLVRTQCDQIGRFIGLWATF